MYIPYKQVIRTGSGGTHTHTPVVFFQLPTGGWVLCNTEINFYHSFVQWFLIYSELSSHICIQLVRYTKKHLPKSHALCYQEPGSIYLHIPSAQHRAGPMFIIPCMFATWINKRSLHKMLTEVLTVSLWCSLFPSSCLILWLLNSVIEIEMYFFKINLKNTEVSYVVSNIQV